jgi:predicted DNA-binding WGR domain protein
MAVESTLFSEGGRIGRGGRVRRDSFKSAGEAFDALAELATKKRKRGYYSCTSASG